MFVCIALLVVALCAAETEKTVRERGLVSKKVSYKKILKHHDQYCIDKDHKHFDGETLAYITPWNPKGYDIAETFPRKFQFLSPAWMSGVYDGKSVLSLTGEHDIRTEWMDSIRSTAAKDDADKSVPKIVPRLRLDASNEGAYAAFLQDQEFQTQCIDKIADMVVKQDFDGIVFEMSGILQLLHQMPEASYGDYRAVFHQFLIKLSEQLHESDKIIIFVIPPSAKAFGTDDFNALAPYIDRFSLMTYDYSYNSKGPQAPLRWMLASTRALVGPKEKPSEYAYKVLMGINMYGRDFVSDGSVEDLTGSAYVELLSNARPRNIEWHEAHHEHSFTFDHPVDGHEHTVYYPTLQFVRDRLRLAKQLGIGVSLWEIGQGLDYFYDLF